MIQGGFLVPFLGALQACVSVLLILGYGAAARKIGLIKKTSIHDMSGIGVKVFLPALIIVHLGEQLKLDNAMNYIPVLVWSILYTLFSILFGHLASKLLGLPPWVTPACALNNTTSLPLLLLQSLESVGSLKMIIQDGDTVPEAIARAQSYFLLCGVISKTIGYAVGPSMLRDGEGPEGEDDARVEEGSETRRQNGSDGDAHPPTSPGVEDQADEEMPLLRSRFRKQHRSLPAKLRRWAKKMVCVFPKRIQHSVFEPFEAPVADVALLCTAIGAVIGLVPGLHKAFFNTYEEGGFFNAWLTSSIKNIGKLFTTLQIFIVGCELGVSFEKKSNDNTNGSTNPSFKAIATIFLVRLVIWPALSISIIYGLAKHTGLLRSDPVLWFSMMLMPAGPPALVIAGLAELANVTEKEKMTIAKTLTIMYILSPCVALTITGALEASKAALGS